MSEQKTKNPWGQSSPQRSTVWQKGYDAFLSGKTKYQNPYSLNRVQYGCCGRGHWAMIWIDGWTSAKEDSEAGKKPKRDRTIVVCANDVLSKIGWRPDLFPPKDKQ